MPRIHFTSIFAAALLVTLLLFYFPWLSGAKAFYLTDITNHFQPTIEILSEYWRKGQFQLWNPYAHCGEPQIAIPQPNLFYPPNWIFALLPFNVAFAWNLLAHQFVAGIGNFLLVMSLGWGFAPACIAGSVAALSAYMFSLSTNYTLMASAAWLPLSVFSLRAMRGGNETLHLLVSTTAMSMMILTGRPEIFAPALLLLAGYILFSLQQNWHGQEAHKEVLKIAGLQFLAVTLATLFSAPFILPAIEWQVLSPRAQGLVSKEVLVWSANWYDFLSMLVPQPLGDLFVHPDKFLNLAAARPGYPPYLIAFVGPVVIALAIVGILDSTWCAGLLISGALFLFLILAAGDNLPIAPYLVSNFPKLAILRFPVKLLFFPVWFLSLFAARGLYLVLQHKCKKWTLLVNLVIWVVLALSALALPIYQQTFGIAISQTGSATVFKAQQLICQSLLTMSLLGLSVSILLWLRQRDKIGKMLLSCISVVSIYGLLMIHACLYTYHAAPGTFFETGPTYIQKQLTSLHEDVNQLIAGQGGRIVSLYFAGLLMPNKLLGDGDPDWPASYYQYGRQILTPSTHFNQRLCSSFGYEGAETADYRRLFVESFNKSHIGAGALVANAKVDLPFYRFCQVTSTKYVFGMIDRLVHGRFVESAQLDEQFFELLLEDRIWNIRIYKVKNTLPRAYMQYNWQRIDSGENAVDKITNADVRDFDPWSQVLLTSAEKLPSVDHLVEAKNWQANFVEYSANKVRLKISTKSPGFLVLTDHYYPGWQALVDQRPATICKANGVLRAVFIQAGDHDLEFKYDPESLKTGFLISALAAFGLLLSCGFLFLRSKRP